MSTNLGASWRYPGARWWKFDFHTHTPESEDYGKGAEQDRLKTLDPEEWLLAFMRAGVDCVAVTDHNTGAWIDPLKQALGKLSGGHPDFRPLHLFPGVEITASGGIHVLALLDTDKGTAEVTGLLGAVSYRGTEGSTNTAANATPLAVVEEIAKRGGIPILAHVDQRAGAWELRGSTLSLLLEFAGLYAIEVVDPASTKPDLYRQHGSKCAEVVGSDSHHPTGAAGSRHPGSHYTWVKMAKPSLEGLRLALLDGSGFSIRRGDAAEPFDPYRVPEHFIDAVEVKDARFMGRGTPATIAFSPWLNALVGGRGTGKSTVIHALRLASRRERELAGFDDGSEPRATFERFNRVAAGRMDKGGLTEETRILWTTMRDGVRHRVHWRQDGSGTTVEEEVGDGASQPAAAQGVSAERFPVRIFSQGQISALAGEDQTALLQVIDEAAGVGRLKVGMDEKRREFFAMRARIRDLDGKLARREDLIVERRDVDRKLRRFEEARHTEVLTAYRHRGRQHREVERQFDAADAAAERIEALAATLELEDRPDGLFDGSLEDDQEVALILDELAEAVRLAGRDLADSAKRLRDRAKSQRDGLAAGKWQDAHSRAEGDYQSYVETLKTAGVTDSNEYGRLAQQRQAFDSELADLNAMEEERDRLIEESKLLLEGILEARRGMSAARDEFLTGTLAHNDFVRIQNRAYGTDPQVIERSLRAVLETSDHFEKDILVVNDGSATGGWVAELLSDLPDGVLQRSTRMEQRISEFKDRVVKASQGRRDFGGHFNRYLARESGRKPELLDRILTWFPEDGLTVEYSPQGTGGGFRSIAQASAGQRSAAMLAFLLAYGDEPLVLDQPEDDLDNHLIYDLVVRQIRENKLRRQIVVVTHNPNIVVNGDAEMLHVLDFRNGQCKVVQSGSLQEKNMRDEVCRVLEGGREAFERRYRRLGPETSHV